MSRCVLVAESDPVELELIATVLARDGFRVLQALEREQAMAQFTADEVPLVIAASDVSGRGGGAALCAEVKKAKPETRFIILHPSGNDPDARTVLLSRTGCDAVLPSPFRYDALKRILGEWGLITATRPAAVPVMSFAVPPPDVEHLVPPPVAAPEPPAPIVSESSGPMPIPIPVLVPAVETAPVEVATPIAESPVGEAPAAVDEVPVTAVEMSSATAETSAPEAPAGMSPAEDVSAAVQSPTAASVDEALPIAEPPVTDDEIKFEPITDEPTVATPPPDMDDDPTVDTRLVAQLSAIEDEPTVDAKLVSLLAPIDDEPTVEAASAYAQAQAHSPEPIAEPPPPPQAAPEGDWLLAPPPQEANDGFAGIDFGAGIDSALDSALGETPTARYDALPDEAARSVELAVQAYVTESLQLDGFDEPSAPAPVEGPPELPSVEAQEAEPPPELPSVEAEAVEAPPELPTLEAQAAEPPPELPSLEAQALPEPPPIPIQAEAPPPLPPLPPPTSGATRWNPQALSEPMSTVADQVAATLPPPAPQEFGAPQWNRTGASSWQPPAPLARPVPAPVTPPVPPLAQPPTPPVAMSEGAPPPPPREALDEPPALPFEAIVQRTPVGPEPRTTLPPSVPPEGDLATTPLPRLLFELYGGTYCGTLRLSRKGADRIIDVWNGFPVAVTVTPDEGDDLATLLRDHGRITPEQYNDAKKRAGSRAAQLLVALGVIDERDLLDVIQEQTEVRLAASFSWRDGTYKITPSRAPPESVVLSEVHPVKIIWRGVCEHYDVGSLLAFFSPLRARYVVATEVFPIHYETLGPFLRRVGVAHLLNGQTTFEQALRSDDSHALTIAHTLYVLIVTEMIRAQSKPGQPAKFPEAQATTKQSQPVDYRELTRACEDVARTYLSLKGRDYFEMLQLSRQATDKEVVAAYERLAKPYKLENLLPGLPDDVQRRAREIDQMLRRARDTLSSPEERRRYLARLDETQPPPPPADAMAS